jgi:non-ribosomal peptide synthetase component E (peptide arylation enzyme)
VRPHWVAPRDAVTPPATRQRYLDQGLWDDATMAGRVAHHARARPDAIAVVDGADRYSYGRLCSDAAAVGAGLIELGVEQGTVVSVQLPNRYEFAVLAVAVQSIGAVINPLLPNYRARELGAVFTTAAPRVIVTPADYRGFDHRSLITGVNEATGIRPHHVVVGGEPGPQATAYADLASSTTGSLDAGRADAVSELIFTSGTEARPKAIMHTEQTANFSVRVARSDLGLSDDDVVWMPSPLGHSTGFNYGLRFALYHGLRLVLQDRWCGEAAAALVEAEQCSYTLAAATFLQDLVEAVDPRSASLGSLRFFGCGGSAVPPALVDAASERGVHVLRLYGSTEVLVATWNRPGSRLDQRRHTDGMPLSHVDIEVRDDRGDPVGPDQPGELAIRGPNTCVGYFDDAERTAVTFVDGWVLSGDLVTEGRDGSVTVVGRKKEIIIRGGINITPREIEEMLALFPEIERAAVVGLPDERLGERMCACVVLHPGASLDLPTMVGRLTDGGLATYKLPERLEVVDSLPTTASGKITKHEIVRTLMQAESK